MFFARSEALLSGPELAVLDTALHARPHSALAHTSAHSTAQRMRIAFDSLRKPRATQFALHHLMSFIRQMSDLCVECTIPLLVEFFGSAICQDSNAGIERDRILTALISDMDTIFERAAKVRAVYRIDDERCLDDILLTENDRKVEFRNDARARDVRMGDVIKQGTMLKKAPNRSNWKRRWFVLKLEYCFYFASQDDPTFKGIINLRRKFITIADSEDFKKPFVLLVRGEPTEREFALSASSEDERQEWLAAFNSCIVDPLVPK
jgi:hypothetical protein